MALSYKARKRLSLVVLLVGLPLYIVVAVSVVSLFDRPPILLELLVYVVLGFLWMIPLRKVFLGVGRPDPDADPDSYPHDPVDPNDKT
ncbi:DUF2842 domain-containing protein [Aliiroseovarius sediminis]|uniref:DUF2842 domain-containing protein n=1 Tax=Aliiroseovarius sediminis TaxID=2925839 RepID=UPI001F58ADB6|nr:DUF2842 domain-containing protein [Aliiroseovarius sediminis]MCI2392929.1 DUF2842 domain-containing protein [Aliiroseovarius sediminis]